MATKLFLRTADNEWISGYRAAGANRGPALTTSTVSTAASGTQIQWTNTAGGTALAWVSGPSPVGGWTLSGVVSINIWALESNINANCKGRARLYKRNTSGVETEIGGGPFDDDVEFGTTTPALFSWTGTPTSTSFAEDERLVVKLFITNSGTMGGGRTCDLTAGGAFGGGNGDTWIQLTETITFKAEPSPPINLVGRADGLNTPTTAFITTTAVNLPSSTTNGLTTPTATLSTVSLDLDGSSDGSTSTTGALTTVGALYPGDLVGRTDGLTTPTGTLSLGSLSITGTADGLTDVTATLTLVSLEIDGRADGLTTPTATLSTQVVNLVGTADGSTSVTSTLTTEPIAPLTDLEGRADGLTDTTATLDAPENLEDQAVGYTSITALLTIGGLLTGGGEGQSGTGGEVVIAGKLVGVSTGITATTARLNYAVLLIGRSDGDTTVPFASVEPVILYDPDFSDGEEVVLLSDGSEPELLVGADPLVYYPRYRTVVWSGSGNFGSAPTVYYPYPGPGVSFPAWSGATMVNAGGVGGIFASWDYGSRIVSNDDEAWYEYRLILYLYGMGEHVIYGDWTGHFVIRTPDSLSDPRPWGNNPKQVDGSYSFVIVNRHYEVHLDDDLKEKSYQVSFEKRAGASVTFYLADRVLIGYAPNNFPPPAVVPIYGWSGATFTLSANGSWESPGQTADQASDAGYGQSLHFYGINPGIQLHASAHVSDLSLNCIRSGFNTQKGSASLTGNAHSATATFGETIVDYEHVSDQYFEITHLPEGHVASSPSWAMQIQPRGYNYEDNSNVPMKLQLKIHGQYRDLAGGLHTFTPFERSASSPSNITVPSSGFLQYFETTLTDGRAHRENPVFPGFPSEADTIYDGLSTIQGAPVTGKVDEHYHLYSPDIRDQVGAEGLIGFPSLAYLLWIDNEWADEYGVFARSAHHATWSRWGDSAPPGYEFYPLKSMRVIMGPPWEQGRITIAEEHEFQLFNDTSTWDNHQNVAIANLTTGLSFTVSATPASVRTIANDGGLLYQLKPYGYRYLRLRIKSSIPNATIRFCVGDWKAGGIGPGPGFPKFGWTLKIDDADHFHNFEIDLLFPDLVGKSDGTWNTASRSYHTDEIFGRTFFGLLKAQHQPLWFQFDTVGPKDEDGEDTPCIYTIEYLTGFISTVGDRKILIYHPLDGVGTSGFLTQEQRQEALEAYDEEGIDVQGGTQFLRLVVNGNRTITFMPSGTSFEDLWDELLNTYGVADTGITIVPGTDPRKVRKWEGNSDLQEAFGFASFGREFLPDGVEIRRAHQHGEFPHGYYGMGNAWNGEGATYGRTNIFRAEWIFGGEVNMVSKVGADLVELRDNDTEDMVTSAFPDDDGFYRLFGNYGVRRPVGNVSGEKEYTEVLVPLGGGTPYSITYTTQGKKLNSYWVWSTNYAVTPGWNSTKQQNQRLDVPILDRYQTWIAAPSVLIGTDITATLTKLHWIVKDGTKLLYGYNLSRGKMTEWVNAEFVATVPADCLPTITSGSPYSEALFVGHHTATDAHIGVSDGSHYNQWGSLAKIAGRKWPRVCVTMEAVWAVMCHNNDLEIYQLFTWSDVETEPELLHTLTDLDTPGLVGYSSDYRNRHILVYKSGGNYVQRANRGRELGAPEIITGSSGREKLVAMYPWFVYPYGRHFFWDPAELKIARTLATFIGEVATDGVITPDIPIQIVGTCIDHFGIHWMLGQRSDGTPKLFRSDNGGKDWQEVTDGS